MKVNLARGQVVGGKGNIIVSGSDLPRLTSIIYEYGLVKPIGKKLFCLRDPIPYYLYKIFVREGSPQKNYESLDICPNWVYPTYLGA